MKAPDQPPAEDALEAKDELWRLPEPAPGYPMPFRALAPRQRWVRAGVVAFVVLHLGSMLIGGAITPVRNFFTPIVGFYTEALRMTNGWGMFGKPPTATNIDIYADLSGGGSELMSTTQATRRTFTERVRDVRMRKILGRLSEAPDRGRLGGGFMDYYCRLAKERYSDVRSVRAVNVIHETRDDDGKVNRVASTQEVMNQRCGRIQQPPLMRLPRMPSTGTAP